MNMLIIGGLFDQNKGKSSTIIQQLYSNLIKNFTCELINGGNINQIKNLELNHVDCLLWMPNIDNSEDKIIDDLKQKNQKMILVSSKRVIEKDFYKESDIVGRLLKTKSNLGIMITKGINAKYHYQIIDPLGNQFASTELIEELAQKLSERLIFLKSMTRINSTKVGGKKPFSINPDFIQVIKKCGHEFSKHVNAINPNRFLGNASTRCSYGFPAVRDNNCIYVSERNVDKENITSENFVEVYKMTNENKVCFYGDKKPSVDTPIQIELFKHFKNVNYIIHGHVYVEKANFTHNKFPCGSLEEFHEIANMFKEEEFNFCVNLKGHGCLILAKDLDFFNKITFISRTCPEI